MTRELKAEYPDPVKRGKGRKLEALRITLQASAREGPTFGDALIPLVQTSRVMTATIDLALLEAKTLSEVAAPLADMLKGLMEQADSEEQWNELPPPPPPPPPPPDARLEAFRKIAKIVHEWEYGSEEDDWEPDELD